MEDIFILLVVTLAAGFLRGLTGFGFALAAVPLYSLVVTPLHAVVLAQLLQIAAAPVDIAQNYRSFDRKSLLFLFVGALIGAPVGAYLATQLSPDVMRLIIAVFVLLGLAALLAKLSIREGKGPAICAGAVAGLLSGLAAMPGPPAIAYFIGRGVDKVVSRASLLLFFAATALIAICFVAMTTNELRVEMFVGAGTCFPVLMVGTWLGTQLFQRFGESGYRNAALGVLLASAVMTGVKGLSGLL